MFHSTTIGMYQSTTIRMYHSTNIGMYYSTTIGMYHSTTIGKAHKKEVFFRGDLVRGGEVKPPEPLKHASKEKMDKKARQKFEPIRSWV